MVILVLAALFLSFSALAQSSAFTYQGRLNHSGSPATGLYEITFVLSDSPTNGNAIGTPVTVAPVPVTNGLFTATLDFGPSAFTGAPRWLEISVTLYGSDQPVITLEPRQPIFRTPYALHALTATGVASSSNLPVDFAIGGSRVFRLEPNLSVVGGPTNNVVSSLARRSVIGGGEWNLNRGPWSVTSGGIRNTNTGVMAAIGGGGWNASTNQGTTVAGGVYNVSGHFFATVGGGLRNKSSGDASTVAGGADNVAGGERAAVGGGQKNIATGRFSTVSGGISNAAVYPETVICGGRANSAYGQSAIIAGGSHNLALASYTCIAGGSANLAFASHATIAGGSANLANGPFATVPGGFGNQATNYAFAAGHKALAIHESAFVWADSYQVDDEPPLPFASTAAHEFSVRATGGVRFVTAIRTNGVPLAGVSLAPGSGTWSSLSDRNAKENSIAAEPRQVLDKVSALPIATWNYKSQDKSIRHIGPTAQDFHAAFNLGENDRTITTVDADGVALAAIQGLNQKLEAELKTKDAQIRQLQSDLAEVKQLLQTLANR